MNSDKPCHLDDLAIYAEGSAATARTLQDATDALRLVADQLWLHCGVRTDRMVDRLGMTAQVIREPTEPLDTEWRRETDRPRDRLVAGED